MPPATPLVGLSSANTTALISAGAVLVGILLGGLITAGTTAFFERRRDRADSRQARRLLAEELRTIWTHLDEMTERKTYPLPEALELPFLPTAQWEENKAMLARHLDDRTWDVLSPFMDLVPTTRALVEQAVGHGTHTVIPPNMLERIEDARDLAADSYSLLTDGGSPAHA